MDEDEAPRQRVSVLHLTEDHLADEDDEQARRQGIERPGVADARNLQRAADERDDVVGRRTRWLVEEQRAVHKKGLQSAVNRQPSTVNG